MNDIDHVRNLTRDLSVLYVEDDPGAQQQIAAILEKFFARVIVASDGEEGIAAYQKSDGVDLIISDIQMPRMNGIDMLKTIKAVNEEQQALIISAHNEIRFFTDAVHIGVDGFIIKPVDMEQLFSTLYKSAERIHTRLENSRYQDRLEATVRERTRRLEIQMLTDDLTGLANRKKLDTTLADGKERTLLLADIDNFGRVNTAYGYCFSDQVLLAVAERLKKKLPEDALLFRANGDQFIYLAEELDTEESAKIADHLIKTVHSQPFTIGGIDISLTLTIGVARGKTEKTMIHAYTAVKESRLIGNNRFEFYNPNSRLEASQKNNLEWAKRVKEALKENKVVPYFQPIVNNFTGEVEKYECLARLMDHDEAISPALFIEPARVIGLLPQITRTMIDQCCSYFSGRDEHFTINITEHDLKEGYLPDYLDKTVQQYRIAPERLTLEILENISAEGTEETLNQLCLFKEQGFKIALDDFGSETSNFSRLRNLQVDYIKIDGSYIKNLDTDENSMKIVQTITRFAELIDAKVIAEFVHNEAVEKAVRDLWIHYSQGYYFGKPCREVIKEVKR